MKEFIDYKAAICNRGNLYRVKQVMKRAVNGEALTVGFIGGSITQGSLATNEYNCYAYKVFSWWKENFQSADFKYVNAGIGGTTSHFAAARVDSDLLSHAPDVVFVEFSVNDESDEHFLETYEGLVRHIYQSQTAPAVILISNVFYDTGANAQLQHSRVARHYQLPLISMQSSIYPAVRDGKIEASDITPDNLHPNDMGHELVASVVNYFLDRTMQEILIGEQQAFNENNFPESITANTYETAIRINSRNVQAIIQGFRVDNSLQEDVTDCFKNGWLAENDEASISIQEECSGIAVQYRKYVEGCAPKAHVMVDGKEVALLDGNFDETWGDKLELTIVLEHADYKKHSIEIKLECKEDITNPFNLVSIILAR
ncbi:SGNH/GDSL hydrolase family protein [Butyrivibrio sp. VCB2001]|jgi:lysophospholipase L1-like esterase|uniref:SGNH/GDSL hydrolase family protein n=1 Tax=Butyrivibrio sp. VCB2001 TaxID=1280667 RepID=UPI0003FBB419|nr:SGNH/GDSL hydrolase family protein [Butyrivibrio sp. VCB2001]